MSTLRFKALETALNRPVMRVTPPSVRVSDYYASYVFNDAQMKNFLSKDAYQAVQKAISNGEKIDRAVAEQIASGMKSWAISHGVTHYTHWFQPLTGSTAEKHDSFFEPTDDGRSLEKFSGNALVQQEPDASSFPSGGLRNTFEARGYTAWDPSSPAFIMEGANGKTLCVPTIFVSYTGEALDYKAPLLKALHAVENAVVDICSAYFDKHVNKAFASLGIEQEYFLIDEAMYYARPDLMLTGRTLLGHAPEKGQQLEDHYFGSIPTRVHDFMVDFETECYKLGIPLKTRHNEVAPSQYECAPNFEEVNLAIDHNQLLMDVMEKIAQRHGFKVLLHEKPFAGVNGSGKHNNWSLITNTGVNLLAPGKTPENNIQFLTFFVNVIKAVHDHADLLRASIASAANDHRLGANEAPPAIMSVFIGSQLTHILEEMVSNKAKSVKAASQTSINVKKIPDILLDNTDRNRTSPFAFTGNKFEFRAVGSSANCANAMIVLNTIVANRLNQFKKDVDARIAKGDDKDEAILKELQRLIKVSKPIRFEGNGYGDEWVKEAAKRGLSNLKDTPSALKVWKQKSVQQMFEKLNVLTHEEIHARYEIEVETYVRKREIEARVTCDLALNHIIPAAVSYQTKLVNNVEGMMDILGNEGKALCKTQIELIKHISKQMNDMKSFCDKIAAERTKVAKMDPEKQAEAYSAKIKPLMDDLRNCADALELITEDASWPLPKMRELLFTR